MTRAILLIEGQPALRTVLRLRFEAVGLEVIEATTSRQALHAIAQPNAAIGAVICGIDMSGPNGETFFAALHAFDPAIRVYFFSASEPNVVLPNGAKVFAKPDRLMELYRAVRDEILGR